MTGDIVRTEVRLSTVDRLDEVLSLPVDAVGIGQEGCLAKTPDLASLRRAARRVRAAGCEVVLVAPVAWPHTADRITEMMLAAASDGPVTIAANDAGTALQVAADAPAGTTVIAGLAMTRSRAHAGSATEPVAPQRQLDRAMMDVLYRHGVSGMETDTGMSGEPGPAQPWHIRQLVTAIPAGYGRSCPTARHHQTGPPGCQHLCDSPYTITASQRWQLVHGHREPLPASTATGTLTVWGNAVYQDATIAPTASYLIIDARWHPHDLAETVHTMRAAVMLPAGR